MLKKVIVMVASKYSAVKAKMREIETRFIIRSLLLQEKKLVVQCFNAQNMVEDEGGQSDNSNNSFAATPISITHLAEEEAAEEEKEKEEEEEKEDTNSWDHSVSVIEMVKKAVEGQGKEFRLEEDIDQVADLFIQRFHHQIRLQKFHFDPPFLY